MELAREGKSRCLVDILTYEGAKIFDNLVRRLYKITVNTELDERRNCHSGTSLEVDILFTLRIRVSNEKGISNTNYKHLYAVHDTLHDRADLVRSSLQRDIGSCKCSRDSNIVLRLDIDISIDASGNLRTLILDNGQLSFLCSTQASLELIKHLPYGGVSSIDSEATFACSCDIDFGAKRRYIALSDLALVNE